MYQNFKKFYFQERIATIEIVSAILRAAQDEEHAYHKICRESAHFIVKSSIDGVDFKTFAVDLLVTTVETKLPRKLESIPAEAVEWSKQNLLEQKCLLSLLIMIFYNHYPTPQQASYAIKCSLKMGFGMLQINRPFFDNSLLDIYQSICNLHSIFFVENLGIENVLLRLQSSGGKNSPNVLLDDSDKIQDLYFLVWDHLQGHSIGGDNSLQPTSVVAVSLACYMQFLLMVLANNVPDHYREIYNQLTRTDSECKSAQKLLQYGYVTGNALDYIAQMLTESSIFQKDHNEVIYKTIIKSMLDILFVTQNVASLPDREKLVKCFSLTYSGIPSLCKVFWTYDFELEDNRSLLDATQRAFPLVFGDFCEMLCALVADDETADYLFQYMTRLPSFADYCRESDYEPSLEVVNGNTVWRWKGQSLVYGAPNIMLQPPYGTEAFELSSNTLLLRLRFSGWFLFLSYLDSYLHLTTTHVDAIERPHGTLETTISILKVINSLLESGDNETITKFFRHLDLGRDNFVTYGNNAPDALASIVGEILNRVSSPSSLSLSAVNWCIGIMKNMLRHYPETIWKRLRVQKLLPQYGATLNPGYLQQGVIAVECQQGCYPTTISFLNLVKTMIIESQTIVVKKQISESISDLEQIQSEILCSCLLFTLREIFPLYSSWQYKNISDKYEIGYLIISIFNSVLQDTTWYFKETASTDDLSTQRISAVQSLIIQCFIDHPSTYQLSPLLEIIGIGNTQPMEYRYYGRRKEAVFLEDSIAESLLMLRNLLVILVHRQGHISGLESAILDRTVRRRDGSNREFIHVIASYIDYQNSDLFAQFATEVLTLLCNLTSNPSRAPTSFVGYLGSDAFSLSSKFVELVNDTSMMSADSPLVQMSIYSFITAVVESQPGLCGFFLNGIESRSIEMSQNESEMSKELKESSILFPAVHSIKKWKDLMNKKPIVLASIANFLLALWRKAGDHRATLSKLRHQNEFWKGLVEIISFSDKLEDVEHNVCFQVAKAKILKLLALEVVICKNSSEDSSKINAQFGLIHDAIVSCLYKTDQPFGLSSFSFEPSLTEKAMMICQNIKPAIELQYFRRLSWNDFFEADRHANGYLYDTDLLRKKLNLAQNISLFDCGNELLDVVEKCNANWIVTDQELECLKSSIFVVKLTTSKLWNTLGPKLSADNAISLLGKMIDHLKDIRTRADIHIMFRDEISAAVVFLAEYVSSSLGPDSKEATRKVIHMLGQLGETFILDSFPFGPFGQLSNFTFHREVLAAYLILLKSLQNIDIDTKAELIETLTRCFPVICQGLHFVLGGFSSDGRDESLLLSLLYEMTRSGSGISASLWIPMIKRYQIFHLMLNAFARWESSAPASLTCNPEQILQVLLSFSCQSPASTIMAADGIVSSFCYNTYSAEIMEGKVKPYDGFERQKSHRIWILMLSNVAALMEHLGSDHGFMESIIGFIRLYQEQIISALNAYKTESMSMGRLDEIDRIVALYYRLAVSIDQRKTEKHSAQNLDMSVFKDIQEYLLRNLALCVFLFKNPNELKSRMKPLSRNEKALYENEVEGKLQVTEEFYTLVRKRMLVICLRVVAFFVYCINSDSLLIADTFDENTTVLFSPTLSSFHDYGATFGTLFDLVRRLASQLKSEYDGAAGKPPTNHVLGLIFGSEITLTTIACQLKLLDQVEGEYSELKTEFQSIIVELNTLFKDAVKTWKQGAIQEARDYMIHVGHSLI